MKIEKRKNEILYELIIKVSWEYKLKYHRNCHAT